MKKFTALMLVVLMVVSFVPFGAFAATEWTEVKTAEDFAKMTDGKYWLTADIDLSKAAWTTIAEFSGTLNGNGKTVTVPADAPIFDKVSGTVKNVNLKGAMALDDADRSALGVADGNTLYHPLGVLANYAFGATIENVHSAVELTYVSGRTEKATTNQTTVGGLFGAAMAAYTVEGEEGSKAVVLGKSCTITNVSVAGKITADWGASMNNNRDNFGGLLGAVLGNTDVSLAVVSAEMNIANTAGNKGGIVGYAKAAYEAKMTGADAMLEKADIAPTFTDCLFNGSFALTGNTGERWGGIVGYARNIVIKNCANEGNAEGGTVLGIVGYGNRKKASDGDYKFYVENSVALGEKGCDTWVGIKCVADVYSELKNIPVLAGKTLNGSAKDAPGMTLTNITECADAAAVRAAFLANGATNFEVKDGVLALKAITFTPEADPFAPTPVLKDADLEITADDVVFSDYTDPNQTALDPNKGTTKVEADAATGALKITRDYTGAGHYEIRFALQNKGLLGENKYLVVWADFTNVEMRKACFGLIQDNEVYPYRTDDDDKTNPVFYYLADGTEEWTELKHGGDGCFGTADNGSQSMIGKKGYFAFPVADFLNDVKKDAALTSDSLITDVYFFGTFPDESYKNVPFYFGDFQLVEDYTTITEPDEPDTPAPTGDMTIVLGAVALVSLAAVTVIAKKKVNE